MRILLAYIHYPVSSGRYIKRALTALGHDVRSLGPCTGNQIWGIGVDPAWVDEPSVGIEHVPNWLPNANALAALEDWRPELVITADSAYTITGQLPVPHVCWGVDNHVRDYRLPETRFDAFFGAHSWGQRMGEPGAHWLPAAYEPADHHDLGLERDIDVALVGVLYPERQRLLGLLTARGLKVVAGMGALYEQYNQIYNRARLALVLPVGKDLPHRFLENLAQGCCVLAPRIPDAETLGFRAFIDYVPFGSDESLVGKAEALATRARWTEYAWNGQRTGQPHTWQNRAAEMLRVLAERRLIPAPEKEPSL